MEATSTYKGRERRAFLRIGFEAPIRFKVLSDTRDISPAVSKNISKTGLLFTSEDILPISSFVWMNLDINTLSICSEIEQDALVLKEGIVGKVVRVDENDNGTYDIGICFVKKAAPEAERLKSLLVRK
jgi:hypothetical protein